MEKTLGFALKEALQMGYQAGRIGNSFDAMALREQIAQEIESRICKEIHTSESDKNDCWWLENGMKKAAQIARGNE